MNNWVKIWTYTHRYEADLASGRLATEGIESFITEEMSNTMMNYFPMVTGGVSLLVRPEDEERAMEVLNS